MATLSDELVVLRKWFDAERRCRPEHSWTEARLDAFSTTLRQLAVQAEGLEAALRQLEARQLAPVSVGAVVDGIAAGRVVVLATHRSLVAHGLDDPPDRRFGEDGGPG